MPWWGALILTLVAAGSSAIIMWLAMRVTTAFEPEQLKRIRERIKKEISKAEAERVEAIEAQNEALHHKLQLIEQWYARERAKIKEMAQNEYQALIDDPGALNRKLDELLSGTAGASKDLDPER